MGKIVINNIMARSKTEKTEEVVDSVQLAAKAFIKNNKTDIYNDPMPSYKVSTGVFSLDYLLGGGLPSGAITRLLGVPGSGKTSAALLVIKNFFETRERARVIIFPTEARLTENLKTRSGLKFIDGDEDHIDQWENKSVLILNTNVYEKIANLIISLVKTNGMRPKKERENFLIFIDSMDYLVLQSDLEKEIGEARKVAGPQYMTKMLWSVLALPFNSDSHMFLATSQQSAAPKIDKYAKDPLRQGSSSGGTNIQYQSTVVLEFLPKYESDDILENDKLNYCEKTNKRIGSTIRGIIHKSDNETARCKFEYKIKFGRKDGSSVWVENDITDWLVSFELLYRETGKGAWYKVRETLLTELKIVDKEISEQFQGLENFRNYLENNPLITDYLYKKMLNSLVAPPKPEDGVDPLGDIE